MDAGHMMELFEYTSPNDRQTYKPRSSDVGSVHTAFYVENIDALLARIASFVGRRSAMFRPLNPASAKGFA
jgi:hypothetical protein